MGLDGDAGAIPNKLSSNVASGNRVYPDATEKERNDN